MEDATQAQPPEEAAGMPIPEYAELVEVKNFACKLLGLPNGQYAMVYDTLTGRRYAFVFADLDGLDEIITQAKMAKLAVPASAMPKGPLQ